MNNDQLVSLPVRPVAELWPSVCEEVEATARKHNGTLSGTGDAILQKLDDGFAVLAWPIGFNRSVAMRLSPNVVEVLVDNQWRNLAALMSEDQP